MGFPFPLSLVSRTPIPIGLERAGVKWRIPYKTAYLSQTLPNLKARTKPALGWALGQRLPSMICAWLAIGAAFASPIGVGDGESHLTKWFAIPRQPLTTALQTYSQQTGVQILYESNLAAGQMSANIEGAFTAKDALQILLSRTDLVVHYTHENAITLTRLSRDEDLPPADVLSRADLSLETLRVHSSVEPVDEDYLHEYTNTLQLNIKSALQKNEKTRTGQYKFGVKLWIGSRTVQRIELFQSTADRDRDASIAEALQGLVVSRAAPANTPQPVRVLVTVRSTAMNRE